jgi:hypothetical protein
MTLYNLLVVLALLVVFDGLAMGCRREERYEVHPIETGGLRAEPP